MALAGIDDVLEIVFLSVKAIDWADSDFDGVEVNDLARSKSGSTWAYGDGGQHYLEINSECSWTVNVVDEG